MKPNTSCQLPAALEGELGNFLCAGRLLEINGTKGTTCGIVSLQRKNKLREWARRRCDPEKD